MEEHKNNCMICGEDLVYHNELVEKECYYCKEKKAANAECTKNHFVCDFCHGANASQVIFRICLESDEKDPLRIINKVYKHPSVKMHGPEHHFLVPAALLTSYYNSTGDKSLLERKLIEAQKRSSNVLGGFCGFYGTCGAAIGSGIFFSLVTDTTPLSKESWKQANMATADALKKIAEGGGPRCCKRVAFISIEESVKNIREFLNVNMRIRENISCAYTFLNKECIQEDCKYYKRNA